MKRYFSWKLVYSGLDKEQVEIEMNLYISNQGVIFDIEFDFTRGEKARELAENFMKQSDEILNPQKLYQDYNGGDTGIHNLGYKGFNQQGEPIKLYLEVDAKNETILSHEITIQKPDSK